MQYKGISESLDMAIDFLAKGDFELLIDGKNIIDGENVFANVMNYDTKNIEDGVQEGHKKYIDIHVAISGKERLGIADSSELEIIQEYIEEEDCLFYKGHIDTWCVIRDDYFAL